MKRLAPFWNYYGSKHRIAGRYPSPRTSRVIESFCGSAAYACCYHWLDVLLVDSNPRVCGTWDYLIHAPESEIRSLRLLGPDEGPDDLGNVPQEARWLVGFNIATADAEPAKSPRAWWRKYHPSNPEKQAYAGKFWGERRRERIASQQRRIRHWKVREAFYWESPDVYADWFVDPPYQGRAGKHYTFGSDQLDYDALAAWCKERRGQTIVCENAGADWLPFVPFYTARGTEGRGRSGISREVIWHRSDEPPVQASLFDCAA